MSGNVNHYPFNDAVLDALETSLSSERMATYIRETDGDRERAIRLYTWNTALSAAFYGPLQGLEVVVRNAMHRELSVKYGRDWYDNPRCGLDGRALERIGEAKATLARGSYSVDPPHVVAELPFGFWVSLLGKGGAEAPSTGQGRKRNYDMTLWRPALYKAFPNSRRSRVDTHRPLDYLRTLRNRIAHHEPIFNRHLAMDFESILEVAGWICPQTSEWINHHSRVSELLVRGPKDDSVKF